jgi:hypothetical protein
MCVKSYLHVYITILLLVPHSIRANVVALVMPVTNGVQGMKRKLSSLSSREVAEQRTYHHTRSNIELQYVRVSCDPLVKAAHMIEVNYHQERVAILMVEQLKRQGVFNA